MTEVLIVGAGPVGLTMAAELTRYGVGVRIIDKAAAPTDKSKALVVWSRTLELLERSGCARAFIDAGLKIRAANIVAGAKQIGHVELDGLDTPYPFALMLPQSETERLLAAQLASLGVRVEREVELKSFADKGNGVTCTVEHAGGAPETIDVRWLIGCDGAHSTVRHALGLPFLGDTLAEEFVLADVHISGYPAADHEISTFWHEDGVLVFFPISPGRSRIVADLGTAAGPTRIDPTLAQMQAIVDRRGPGGVTLSDPVWLASFGINERKVPEYRSGNVFVAGDAAHIHSPAGGQGMNTGMQDAFNLAWKLALASKGKAAAQLIDSYSIERSAIGKAVLAASGRLTEAATLRNPAAQALRNFIAHHLLGLTSVKHAAASLLSEITVGYEESPLNRGSARGLDGPGPGQRVRPRDGEAPFGGGGAPRFAVIAGETPPDELMRRHSVLLEATERAPIDPKGIWLVRPDGYVAMVAGAGRWDEVDAYLAGISA